MNVVIPYSPRPLQRTIHDALDSHRWAAAVCHRRFGKSVLAVNQLQKRAVLCQKQRPRFAYIAPTYTQGKSGVWDYMKYYSAPIPGRTVHEGELRIGYPNQGQVRIFGADNPDSLRGLYFDGVVFDEYGLMPPRIFSEVVRPLLADREGWAFFIGTPNGKNQFYDIIHGTKEFPGAKNDPAWFFAEYRASQTDVLSAEELAASRKVMTADEYAQEFECSFEASVKGAVFAREMQAVREDGRLTRVPYDPNLPVDTDWDLGMGDATSVWFSQSLFSGEVRLIDYYEAKGHGLAHYKQMLNDKAERHGYAYGEHWAPHDIEVRELGSGHSRLETARTLGLNFQVTPKTSLDDGVHAARMLLPMCWFDVEKTRQGTEALQNYRWDINVRIHEFTNRPVHDWSSHGADAFRGLAVRHQQPRKASGRDNLRRQQRDIDESERLEVRASRPGRGFGPRFQRRGGY